MIEYLLTLMIKNKKILQQCVYPKKFLSQSQKQKMIKINYTNKILNQFNKKVKLQMMLKIINYFNKIIQFRKMKI